MLPWTTETPITRSESIDCARCSLGLPMSFCNDSVTGNHGPDQRCFNTVLSSIKTHVRVCVGLVESTLEACLETRSEIPLPLRADQFLTSIRSSPNLSNCIPIFMATTSRRYPRTAPDNIISTCEVRFGWVFLSVFWAIEIHISDTSTTDCVCTRFAHRTIVTAVSS